MRFQLIAKVSDEQLFKRNFLRNNACNRHHFRSVFWSEGVNIFGSYRANYVERGEGGSRASEGDLKKIIAMEWKAIRKLWALAKEANYDKHRAIYFQNLAAHTRILAFLLKSIGPQTEESKDLAKLLAQIERKARKFVR